jgi:uncharacterized protein
VLDPTRVEGFQWDSGNARKNEKHGVTQREAEEVFLNEPLLVLEDPKHSAVEPPFHTLGRTGSGRLLHVAFTLRDAGRLVRVISARPMQRRERKVYGQAPEAHP